MLRVFFTGAFRKPRELNWVIGTLLLVLGIVEGFAGYSLPDDLLSGTGLRITYGITESVPVLGTWAAMLLFGGEFPGTAIVGRLYAIHILLIPGLILGLISFHMMMIWYQKHTQFPGPGRTETNDVGSRFYPVYAAKAGGFFFLVFAVLALLGGIAQINPIWMFGPSDASQVTAGSQPDWYMGFLDGAVRLMPNWEIHAFEHTLSLNLLLPAQVLPGILFTGMGLYPWIEAWMTKDKRAHNLLQRPRENPQRTALGAMAISFYLVLLLAGGNDVIASIFTISIQDITHTLRVAFFVLPPIVYYVTKRICLALQRSDEELLHHGIESGTIRRLPSGEFIEETVPVPAAYIATIDGGHAAPAEIEGHGAETGHPSPGAKLSRGFFRDKTRPRKEPIRPEATMPQLEKSGKPEA
jgi:ubiquinol-cytochrome c reductase cytochrome b subunit